MAALDDPKPGCDRLPDRRRKRPGPAGAGLRALLGAAVLVVLVSPLRPARADSEHDWVGVARCRRCHEKDRIGDQISAWESGPHRRAFETLASDESRAIAARLGLEGPPQQSDACLRCHVSAHGEPAGRLSRPLDPADGVQCESCHGPGRDYRRKRTMADHDQAVREGLWDASEDEAICTACHNAESPTFEAGRYRAADGTRKPFDFEQAKERYPHPIPARVKGRYLELD